VFTEQQSDDRFITISGFNKKGNGIGRILQNPETDISTEIPFTIPGDVFKTIASLAKKKKQFFRSENLTTLSESRIAPRCKHFGICGGCRWQQMAYDEQLRHKEESVRKAFSDMITSDVHFEPIIPCPREWRYRNKMEFSFSGDADHNRYLGLIMDSSKGRVVNLTECHLVNPWYMSVLESVRKWWLETGLSPYRPCKDSGSLRTLVLRESMRTGDRLIMLTVSGNPDYALNNKQLESFVQAVQKEAKPADPQSKLSIFLRIQQTAKGMPTNFYEMVLFGPDHMREMLEVQIHKNEPPQKLHFQVSPTAFFQPNTGQAELLYSTALQMAGVEEGSVVYDLYSGTGTLGICTAKKAKAVISIEVSPESALDARTNAALNSIENITILSGAVRYLLKQIKEEQKHPLPDLVVIDPPRTGIDAEAMQGLLNLEAPKILYISCNPQTQADNIREIIKNGYRLTALRAIDQFAQTPHVEVIAVLERNV